MSWLTLPASARVSFPSRFVLYVVISGIIGGAVGAAYLGALHVVEHLLGPEAWSPGAHIVILGTVGVAVAVITWWLGRPANVELLVDNIHIFGGADDVRNLRSLLPISLLCVGSGGTMGPEAPLVQATGSLGGWLAGRLRLDRRHFRILTITGMAAGFTTLFGAPIGAAVFALEIPHRRGIEHADALIPAFIGSLAGYAVYVVATGNGLTPIFDLPEPSQLEAVDLAWAAAAGIASALVGYAFAYATRLARLGVAPIPRAWRPALGGVTLGLLALANPHVLTNGELALNGVTVGAVSISVVLVAAVAKFAGTVVTLAGEWSGGFIIPLFFIGACLGTAAHLALPDTNQWVLVTAMMVGCNVAVTKTPLGTALVVVEMAGMRLMPTVLIAALIALALTVPLNVIESQRERDVADEAVGAD